VFIVSMIRSLVGFRFTVYSKNVPLTAPFGPAPGYLGQFVYLSNYKKNH
jgi:hypothetical protein